MKSVILASLLFSSLAFAEITVTGKPAQDLWNSINTIGLIENVQVVEKQADREVINLDTVSCVYEEYNACTFYANTESNRNFVIAYDATAKFMATLQDAGVIPDYDNQRMDADQVYCEKRNNEYTCIIAEYVRPL